MQVLHITLWHPTLYSCAHTQTHTRAAILGCCFLCSHEGGSIDQKGISLIRPELGRKEIEWSEGGGNSVNGEKKRQEQQRRGESEGAVWLDALQWIGTWQRRWVNKRMHTRGKTREGRQENDSRSPGRKEAWTNIWSEEEHNVEGKVEKDRNKMEIWTWIYHTSSYDHNSLLQFMEEGRNKDWGRFDSNHPSSISILQGFN